MYDVVVIGAGIGGLTTAALLARDGYRVLVLEGHIEPGGCASSYERRRPDGSRYLFDVGATLFAGFRPGGAHHWVGQRLGIAWPVRPLEPAMEVWLPDERVTRWGDERWQDERRRAFRQSLPASESFWRAQERTAEIAWRFAARMPPLPVESPGDLLGLTASVRPELALILPGMLRTVARELQRHAVSDRTIRAYIDGQLLISAQTGADRCAWLYGAVALDFARIGAHYAEGGAIALARTLVGALLRDGGEIRYRSWVTQILTRGRQAIGVEVAGGEQIAARAVVANMTYADAGRLLGHPPAPADESPAGWGAFMLYLGIDDAAIPPGAAEHHQVIASYDRPLGEANSAFISIHPPDDARRAPPGQRAVTISTHTEVSRWWCLRGDRERYRAEKAAMAERLLATASIVLPQLRSAIRYQQSGTPITFQRYTRRDLGMVGGLPQTPLRSGIFSRGPRSTGVRNLLLVGDSVFPGQSTAAVTQSGIRAYRLIRGVGTR